MKKFEKLIFVILFFAILLLPTMIFFGVKENFCKLKGTEHRVEMPKFTYKGYYDSTYQKRYEEYFAKKFFLRNTCMKTKNQIYDFINFGKVHSGYSGKVIEGKDDVLIEAPYLSPYFTDSKVCEIGHEAELTNLSKLAKRFNELDIDFIVVLAPDKVGMYPEYVSDFHQWLYKADYTMPQPKFAQILEKYNIPYFDSATYLKGVQCKYEEPFFPVAGTHWNALAAGLAAEEAINVINKNKNASKPWQINPLSGLTEVKKTKYFENDIGNLLNLFHNKSLNKNKMYDPLFAKKGFPNRGKALVFGDSFSVEVAQYLIDSCMFEGVRNFYNQIPKKDVFISMMNDEVSVCVLVFNSLYCFNPTTYKINMVSSILSYLNEYTPDYDKKYENLKPGKLIDFAENNFMSVYGFYVNENWGRWSCDSHAKMICKTPWSSEKYHIKLSARFFSTVKYVDVYSDGDKITTLNVKKSEDEFVFIVPRSSDEDLLSLEFDIHDPGRPSEHLKTRDARNIGLGFKTLEFLTEEEYNAYSKD